MFANAVSHQQIATALLAHEGAKRTDHSGNVPASSASSDVAALLYRSMVFMCFQVALCKPPCSLSFANARADYLFSVWGGPGGRPICAVCIVRVDVQRLLLRV